MARTAQTSKEKRQSIITLILELPLPDPGELSSTDTNQNNATDNKILLENIHEITSEMY